MSIPARAFPNAKYNNDETNGMELRDYFAARAMQSFCWHTSPVPMSDVAVRAYEMADAMMEARKK